MNRLSKRFILYGLGILLVIATLAGIAAVSGRSSSTADTGRLAEARIESIPGTVAIIKSIPRRETSGCGVGGAPAMKTNRVNGQMGNLVAGPIVVGCGRRNQELIQLVAFRTTRQLCAEMERPRKEMIVAGSCKPVDIAWKDYCEELCIASVLPADMGHHRRYKHASLFGEASAELTNVKAVLHESMRTRSVSTIEGRVESTDLLETLHESEPFLVFGTMVGPCVPPQDVEIVATGKSGVVRRRGVMSLPHICVAGRPPSSSK